MMSIIKYISIYKEGHRLDELNDNALAKIYPAYIQVRSMIGIGVLVLTAVVFFMVGYFYNGSCNI